MFFSELMDEMLAEIEWGTTCKPQVTRLQDTLDYYKQLLIINLEVLHFYLITIIE